MNVKTIELIDESNNEYYFNDDIDINTIVKIKNCNNLKIFIGKKISKIIVDNSNIILLSINAMIIGIEINKSNYIIIQINNDNSENKTKIIIPMIECYKSKVYLNNLKNFRNTQIKIEESEINQILNE
jgi:hypothetical protein